MLKFGLLDPAREGTFPIDAMMPNNVAYLGNMNAATSRIRSALVRGV
jgi:hypothetical protein